MIQINRFQNYILLGLSCTLIFICCKTEIKETANPVRIDSLSIIKKNPYSEIDQSPMDMAYFPVNYPIEKMNNTDSGGIIARVIYSRPHRKNRAIFGNSSSSLCRYGYEWRLGANEATEIEFYRNVTINGRNISKGAYIMYCVPYEDKWTIVFNSNLHSWGLHMDSTKDVYRTDVPAMVQNPSLEDFTMAFSDASYGADLNMAWDNVKVQLPVEFKK
jgi:hypothetical protein